MAQKLMVDLEFRANTDAAKKQIQSLQQTLNQAINSSMTGKSLGVTPQLEKARLSAMQLKTALESATNVDTGRLNLHKFTNNLRRAGLDVQQLGVQLKRLGPDGMKAFSQMTSAMASAETKIFSIQGGMRRLVNTFANTVRYQASALAIQTVTSSITQAISYTKELDKALTNIQMVTDKSSEEMSRFAVQANKAARALSTSTNEYVKASHIYFQQGLDTGEAMKRAEITIRLAHATGDSMEEVSNWMTAIWNNFEDGTKTLEYYGDVLAKLGAATASSADEIATGLEKFSAVAETVGLSYEYAASALATITAETRQSAEVVGTALKTLFSRMESLQLGDTLDDGTTLNKYSLALQTVGVNIKDTSGSLKDMDVILDETATKWKTLSKDQQVALAQSVAGVRQYTQFIALMDNYDVMQKNIKMSKEASGSLREMHEEYKNSIKGIQDESKAAGEALISALMDEDDIKNFYKSLTGIADFVTKLTKAFGGLEGILLMVANALMKMYQPQIATMFQNMAYSAADLKVSIGNAGKSFANTFRGEDNKLALKDTYAQQQQKRAIDMERNFQVGTFGGQQASGVSEKIYELKTKLLQNEKKLTDEQKNQYQWQIQILEATRDTIREEEKGLAVLEEEVIRKGDLVNAGIQEAQSKRQSNLSTLGTSALSLADIATSPDAVAGMDKTTFANDLINKLIEARRAAQELGGDIKNMGFEDALSDVQMFKESHIQNFSEVQSKIAKVTEEIARLRAVESAKGSSTGVMVDMRNLQDRSGALGAAKADVNNVANMAKGARDMDFSKKDAAEQFGNKMKAALQDTQTQAEKLGLNIKNLGFEDALQDIENFVKSGGQGIEELIQKMIKFQSLAHGGINSAITETADNALVYGAAGKGLGEGLKDIDNIESAKMDNSNIDKRANQAKKAAGKIDESKQTDKMKKAVDKLNKAQQQKQKLQNKGIKLTQQEQKQLDQLNNEINENIGVIQQEGNELKKGVKNSQQYTNAVELQRDKTREAAESSAQLGYKQQDLANNTKNTKDSIDQLKASLDAGSEKIQNLGTKMASIASTGMSLAMGLNMVTNGVASLTTALGKGSTSFSDYLTAAMSLLPGLMQMIPIMSQLHGWIYKKIAAQALERVSSKKTADQSVQDSMREAGGEVAEGMAGVASQAGKGPAGWVTAAASLAMIIPIAAMIGIPVVQGIKKGNQQLKEEKLEENREVNSAAQEVSKTLGGIREQVDTFKNLRESGESTVDVLNDMEKALDDVAFQIDELITKAGADSDWGFLSGLKSQLKIALEDVKNGGDVSEFEALLENTTREMNQTAARMALETAQGSDWTEEDKTAYLTQVGTTVTGSKDLMAQAEKQFLSKQYSSVEEAEKAWGDAAIDAALGPEYANNDSAESPEAIASLLSYAPASVLRVINGLRMLQPNGAIRNKYGKERAQQIENWVGDMTDPRAQYLSSIDFSTGDPSNFDKQYYEAIEQQTYAQKTMDATKYGVSESAFKSYTEALMDNNEALRENEGLASEVALQTVRMAKGLNSLTDKFDEAHDALVDGEEAGFAYYEALSKLSTALKDTFGFEVSSNFIESNLSLIEQVAQGSAEALDELRSKLSKEFIATFDYRVATDENGEKIGIDIATQKQTFKDIVDTVTNGGDISQYYDILNEMIKAGQITTQEIESFFGSMNLAVEMPEREWVTTGKVHHQYYENGKLTRQEDEVIQELLPVFDENTQITEAPSSEQVIKTSNNFDKSEKKEKKKLEDEIERHHALKEELDDLAAAYDRISKARNRAFGPERLELLKQEKQALDAEVDAQKRLVDALSDDVSNDWNTIAKYGASRDESGRLTNYKEMYEVNLDALNAAYDSGNQTRIEAAEKAYNQFKKDVEQYEESLNELESAQDTLIDKQNAAFDIVLTEITETLDYEMDLLEDQLKVLEYQLEQLDDPIYDAAKAMQNLGQQTEIAMRKADSYRKALTATLMASGLNEEQVTKILETGDAGDIKLTADQIENLREYQNNLIETNKTLSEMGDAVHEKTVEAFEKMNEEMEKQGEIVNHNNSLLNSYRNIIDLTGKDALGISDDIMKKLTEAQTAGAINAVSIAKSTVDMNKKALADAEAEYAEIQESLSEIDKERWNDTIETLKNKVMESEQELASSFEEALQIAAEAFDRAVEETTNTFKDAMAGISGSADAMARQFDQQKEISSRFLEDYEKVYQLSKLNRDIMSSIDKTDSLKGKKELRDIQEEILALQESGAEVTQYEVDEMRARYDLRLAEIALEEAQNAKSQVRMRRDSEGNYSYVYTADQDTIDKAQQNYEDKLYAYEKLTHDYVEEIESILMEIPNEMAEALAGLNRQEFATEEEYQDAIDSIRQYYIDKYEHYTGRIQKGLKDSNQVFSDTIFAQVTGYQEAGDALGAFNLHSQECLSELSSAYSTWQTNTEKAYEAAGYSMDTFAKTVTEQVNDIKNENEKAADSANDMADEFATQFEKIVNEAGDWSVKYSLEIEKYIQKNNDLITSIGSVVSSYKGISDASKTVVSAYEAIEQAAKAAKIAQDSVGSVKDTEEKQKVKALQEFLNHHFSAGLTVDGSYGEATQAAVKKLTGKDWTADEAYNKLIEDQSGFLLGDQSKDKTVYGNEVKQGYYFDTYTEYMNWRRSIFNESGNLYSQGYEQVAVSDIGKNRDEKEEESLPKGTLQVVKGDATQFARHSWHGSKLNDIRIGVDNSLSARDRGLSSGTYIWKYFTTKYGNDYGFLQYPDGTYVQGGASNDASNETVGLLGANQKWDLFKKSDLLAAIDRGEIIGSFDTGGYTGEWDSSGRLAMLHQKEIVLNAHDTENFLAAVNIVRDIASAIDLRAAAYEHQLSSMAYAYSAGGAPQMLQQDVTIHAEFPNVRERSEIEAAFDNLINRASQFANRKNK